MGALPTPAPAPVSDLREDGRGIEDRDGVGTTPQAPNGLAGRLLNIPLSNVERLRSTLSVVSLTELIELVPQLVGRSSAPADAHPDKKKLFSVHDFFRYAKLEARSIVVIDPSLPENHPYRKLTTAWRRSLPPGTLDPWIAVPDVQILKLQENPEVSIIHPCCNEDVPTGELPRNMLFSVDRPLVQAIVQRTRLTVVGIYNV